MEKYITDEKTGLKYELAGDYYFLAGDDEPEEHRPIGIWGQRPLNISSGIKQQLTSNYCITAYSRITLLTSTSKQMRCFFSW